MFAASEHEQTPAMDNITGPDPREHEYNTTVQEHRLYVTITLTTHIECYGIDIDDTIREVERDIKDRLLGYRDIDIDSELG